MNSVNKVSFFLNGNEVVLQNVSPKDLLIDYLRSDAVNLKGTKLSCGEGGCGACTVIWSRYDADNGKVTAVPINACLRPICSLHGTSIMTIEYVGTKCDGKQIMDNMVESCGSQCGYCSPGFVMTMYGLLKKNEALDEQAVEDQFAGNICRCTGYRSILNAMHKTASAWEPDLQEQGNEHDQLTKNTARFELEIEKGDLNWFRPLNIDEVLRLLVKYKRLGKLVKIVQGNTSIGIYKANVEDPAVYIDVSALPGWKRITQKSSSLHLDGGVTITELFDYLSTKIQGNNDPAYKGLKVLHTHIKSIAGVQVRSVASVAGSLMMVRNHEKSQQPFPGDLFTVFLTLGVSIKYITPDKEEHVCLLKDFPAVEKLPEGFLICEIIIPFNDPGEIIQTYRVARRIQNSHPIVNAGFSCRFNEDGGLRSLNIVYGGIAHTALLLADASAAIMNIEGFQWTLPFVEKAIAIIRQHLNIFYSTDTPGITREYKIALAVNLFYKFFVYVAKERGIHLDKREFSAIDLHRPVARGDHHFFDSPFFDPMMKTITTPKFLIADKLEEKAVHIAPIPIVRNLEVPEILAVKSTKEPVGKGVPKKIDAPVQVAGRTKYTHDLSGPPDTLNGYYVYSEHRNAHFSYLQDEKGLYELLATKFPDIKYINSSHIPNQKIQDDNYDADYPSYYDPVFAKKVVTCYGQPIGLVVCNDLKKAKEAAIFIQTQIVYEAIEPIICDIEDARKYLSILKQKPGDHKQGMDVIFRVLPDDDPEKNEKMSWMDKPEQVAGQVFVQCKQQTGAQYHFYMEPQGAIAIPKENDQIEIYASTQNHASCQTRIAESLSRPLNCVHVGTTRLGGGFGGKELRQVYVAAAAAVAAVVLNKPVRLLLDRSTDMQMVGTRHPYDGSYSVVSNEEGLISRMRIDYESDAGISFDCSYPVMDLSLLCAENAYNIPVFKTTGTVYRTNTQSRTAFRSFGLVQATLITESAIEHLAFQLNKLPEDIRKLNFYADGFANIDPPITHYGAKFPFGRINQIWDKFREKIEFDTRLEKVRQFNLENKWKKRGISMIPLKYGISYTFRPMNQGSAYIIVYREDGSVMLHHGGVEMGQGLHTKMAQIVATELGIDIKNIRIGETNTATIPNVSSTGASTGSDLNGGAVQMACRILKKNLMDFIENAKSDLGKDKGRLYPDTTDAEIIEMSKIGHGDKENSWINKWSRLIAIAGNARLNLSAQFSFASPSLGKLKSFDNPSNFQIDDKDSRIFYYYNNCVAASEVEIDVLTGQFEILRADLLYDAGDSLNENIDVGQIEGGFIQGVGCLTTEEMLYAESGKVISDGTWEYKPPCTKTIPQEFNVYLLKYVKTDDMRNPLKDTYGINSSKSTGEPPLVLANTVFFAIRHAIAEARSERGLTGWFPLSAPATVEKIQMACFDSIK